MSTFESSNTSIPPAMAQRSTRDFLEASDSTNLSAGMARALSFASPSRPPSPTEDPTNILRRYLSVRSVISTNLKFAGRMSRAAEASANQEPEYKIIGLGSCGSVFEIPGTELALKKGKDIKALWKDFCLTNVIHYAIADTRELVQTAFPKSTIPRTPHCTFFRLPTSPDYWQTNLSKFPASHRKPGALFQVDRILPLPQLVRDALISQYFDEEISEEAKNDEDNQACLVRIYLGENETGNEFYDSLRNFPMRLNMVEELDLDKESLADEMAIALAICHWQAQVDAMDAEFVLGSAQATPLERRGAYQLEDEPHDVDKLDFTTRSIHVWLLDFDKSSRIDLTLEHVEKFLVPAFLGNDPYYPRPDVDAELWTRFSDTHLKASQLVLCKEQAKNKVFELPALFLKKVAETIKEHKDWNLEDSVVFR